MIEHEGEESKTKEQQENEDSETIGIKVFEETLDKLETAEDYSLVKYRSWLEEITDDRFENESKSKCTSMGIGLVTQLKKEKGSDNIFYIRISRKLDGFEVTESIKTKILWVLPGPSKPIKWKPVWQVWMISTNFRISITEQQWSKYYDRLNKIRTRVLLGRHELEVNRSLEIKTENQKKDESHAGD